MKLLVDPLLEALAVLLPEFLLLIIGLVGGFFLPTLGTKRLLTFFLAGGVGEEGGDAFLIPPGYRGLLFVTFTLYFRFGEPLLGKVRLFFGRKFV